jgi:hypothetical protein
LTLTFNLLLRSHEIDPSEVRLLRHVRKAGASSRSPLLTWREDRGRLEDYQSLQLSKDRNYFDTQYWASFAGTPDRETVFVGLYQVGSAECVPHDAPCPMTGRILVGGTYDRWATKRVPDFARYEGRLLIDWGPGARSWGQYAQRRDKPIVELLRSLSEPDYPGHSAFLTQLSRVETLPASWVAILRNARGVYLLSSAKTREQYVGSAWGEGGFHARWLQHSAMSGDAIAFRSRDPEDYRVSILEVAGSLASADDILAMEERWKQKLQSREMGLNRN